MWPGLIIVKVNSQVMIVNAIRTILDLYLIVTHSKLFQSFSLRYSVFIGILYFTYNLNIETYKGRSNKTIM